MVKRFVKQLIYFLWVLNGYWGLKCRLGAGQFLTVLITYYNPARVRHAEHQVRNLLKCDFVDTVIISNHNPEMMAGDFLQVADERLVVLNQTIRRGCGHRWLIADQFSPDYLIVMDDDILLFPRQIRKLFVALLNESDIPHGFAGMVQQENGSLEYHQKTNRQVDYLCEIYALTGKILRRYIHLKDQIQTSPALAKSIETTADFLVVSHAGDGKPRIHHAGHLLRCPTFNQAGVAVHKERAFLDDVRVIQQALSNVELQA